MVSGIAAMEETTERIMSARFKGSVPASSESNFALNCRKSCASLWMASCNASLPTFLA